MEKAEKVQEQNNEKARVCIEILLQFVSPAIQTILKPIISANQGQDEIKLKQCLDKLEATFPVTAYDIKNALDFDVSQIGIAFDHESINTLLVALQMQQQRQENLLTMENPDVLAQRDGLQANGVAIEAHRLQIAGYIPADLLLAVGVHPPVIPNLVLPFPVVLAMEALGAYNFQCNHFQQGVINGDHVNVPALFPVPAGFAYPPGSLPPNPPEKCLKDPSVLLKSDQDWLTEFRNKVESNTNSVVAPLRNIVVQGLSRRPIPTLAAIALEVTQSIANNPQSNNHSSVALHAALAKHHNLSSGIASGRANAAQEGDSGTNGSGSSHAAYAAFAVTKDQADGMTNEELGSKRRAELEAPSTYVKSCHFWGHQGGRLACGKELATGYACTYADYHNPNHQGPPQKQYNPPLPVGTGGQRL